ncbi:hypothetical protein OS493_026202 [Desmophyllum pertusum]|uniref:Uncharacterized protein n=1 Tax=Desmophyllum pertusum TaxID=174260 RepID=A0A9X0D8D1_9CNID|nr:hypothetical protein OS493_026202 [Desmophyllum pertusum]
MPVATRSCTKQKRRPRIEDETPATSKSTNRRYPTRSSAKRKIIDQENEGKGLEPPSKKHMNNTKEIDNNRSPSLEKSVSDLTAIPNDNGTVLKTPAGCIAARIRSYSALRRSQWKKNDKVGIDRENTRACRSPLRQGLL